MITDDQHLICENWLNGGYPREEAQEMLEGTGLTEQEARDLLNLAEEENPDAFG